VGKADIDTIIKDYQRKELKHLKRMHKNQIPELFHQYKVNGISCQKRVTKDGIIFYPCNRKRPTASFMVSVIKLNRI